MRNLTEKQVEILRGIGRAGLKGLKDERMKRLRAAVGEVLRIQRYFGDDPDVAAVIQELRRKIET